jgi:hypothetical protein
MRSMMEAADTREVTNVADTGMDRTTTVQAGMEGVSAKMSAGVASGMTAAMTAPVSSPVPSTAVPAATSARGRDGGGESRGDERARHGGSDGHCSKHGVSPRAHPPAAMLMPSADAGLNGGSRLREAAAYGRCWRPCCAGVSPV